MTDESRAATVTIRRVLPATAPEVFEFWTRPELLMQWMSPYAGEVQSEVEADPRVGGRFRLCMHGPEKECEITGEYVEVDPPRRLAFTWSGPPTNNHMTLVTVELRPLRDTTELTLTHERLPTSQIREGHVAGWANVFDHLSAVIHR